LVITDLRSLNLIQKKSWRILLENTDVTPYWEFCAYPGKAGSPMLVNLKENIVIFNLYAHEALRFVSYSSEGWLNIYDAIFEKSINFNN